MERQLPIRRRLPGLLLLLCCVTVGVWATGAEEPACGTPQLPVSSAPNIFNEQQEVWLGDIFAEMLNDRMESIDDPELTAYAQSMGERLVRHLPPSHLNFRFYLADLPAANALSMAGGRVYLSRKLVARARSEDELAGVIGHELGHIVTHQKAIDWTLYLNKALGVTSVSDRKDIEAKIDRIYQLNSLKRLGSLRSRNESDQQEADRIGMEAVALAGYHPEAVVDFFDRVMENKGRKGSWLSELFQTTAPTPKRYREMLKLLPKLPSQCVETRPAGGEAAFQAWQKKVASYRGTGRRESLHNVALKRELEPPLQDELRTLRFSPDGKYLLAQDSATVYVARRDPLEVLFQIAAPGAYPAMFTADSSEVLVYDRSLRIERWKIGSQERTEVYEVSTAGGCVNFALAPDGNTAACVEPKRDNYQRLQYDLLLIDTESNEPFLERPNFRPPGMSLAGGYRISFGWSLGFSPDGRYFVAASGTKPVVYDLKSRSEAPIPAALAEILKRPFTFLGPDRVLSVEGLNGESSRVLSFPGGETLHVINTGVAEASPTAHGEMVLLRPIAEYAVGALDVRTNALVRGNKKPAFDVYDGTFASEMGSGEVGLFREGTTPIATLKLPRGRLGRLQAFSMSADMRWLAISEAGRGAVWDLNSGNELYSLRGFQGSYMAADGSLYVDFPKQRGASRNIVRLGLQEKSIGVVQPVGDDERLTVHGAFLTRVRPMEEKKPVEQAKLREEAQGKARGDLEDAK